MKKIISAFALVSLTGLIGSLNNYQTQALNSYINFESLKSVDNVYAENTTCEELLCKNVEIKPEAEVEKENPKIAEEVLEWQEENNDVPALEIKIDSKEEVKHELSLPETSVVESLKPVKIVEAAVEPIIEPKILPPQTIFYPTLGFYTSYNFANLNDFYETVNGETDYNKPKNINSPSSSVQTKLVNSPLHVPFTVGVGQSGNAYFIGHNYSHFAPISGKGNIGDIIKISDGAGNNYDYQVYEARYIGINDTETAYQLDSNSPTITLQTCTPNAGTMWIVRARKI